MFYRTKLIILEEPEYGLGPRTISTTSGWGFPRFTDAPDLKRGEKAIRAVRTGATKIRNVRVIEPEEMRFDRPRGKPDRVRLY
jgi:hypothetical protein